MCLFVRNFKKQSSFIPDTRQTMAVAESLANCKGFNKKDDKLQSVSGYEKRPEWFGYASS